MLFVGDILQLQPVNGNPVFETVCQKSLVHKLGCSASVNIWRDSVTYDELTINERQKKDQAFSSILDTVRRGSPTDETLKALHERVIDVSVSEKFLELQQLGQTPVCLFPTRKACDDLNNEMLTLVKSSVHELICKDEVDQTESTRKWSTLKKRETEQ